MIEQVAAAFDRQDYKTAAQLLKQLQQQSPDNLWVKLYVGRLYEVSGELAAAESIYRYLLQQTSSPKVALQARQGLQRLDDAKGRQDAIAPRLETSAGQLSNEPADAGFLVLEAMSVEAKAAAAQAFAQIMKLDAYTARMHLPGRGWRLYRVGAIDEIQEYGRAIQAAKIPVFWASQAQVEKIHVFRVRYLQAAEPQATVICLNKAEQLGSLNFNWAEVSQRVEGMLPIFEEVVDIGVNNKLKWKEKTQDYAPVVDLHLPKRNCILRFGDWSYQFQEGISLEGVGELSAAQVTTRLRWNQLMRFLDDRLSTVPVWSEFTPFAETALEPLALTKDFQPHIDLFRKAPSRWDAAFHLYSALVFGRSSNG